MHGLHRRRRATASCIVHGFRGQHLGRDATSNTECSSRNLLGSVSRVVQQQLVQSRGDEACSAVHWSDWDGDWRRIRATEQEPVIQSLWRFLTYTYATRLSVHHRRGITFFH